MTKRERKEHVEKLIRALDQLTAQEHGEVSLYHVSRPLNNTPPRRFVKTDSDREIPHPLEREKAIEAAWLWVDNPVGEAPEIPVVGEAPSRPPVKMAKGRRL